MGYGSLAVISIIIFFLSLTHKKGTPYTGWKYTVISIITKIAARMNLLGAGFIWIETETIEYDYKKYLGPDWKENKNLMPGTIISNH